MKTIELKGVKRAETGSNANKHVRAQGMVPAIIYGNADPEQISLPYNDVAKALFTPNTYIVSLEIDGSKTVSIIREAQYHPVTDRILHVDFYRIPDGESIEFELPVRLVGTAAGVRNGGRLVPLTRRLKVRGIPVQMPEFVEVDVTDLELGKTIRVSEIDTDIELISPPSAGVAMVDIPRAVRTGEAGGEEEGEEEEV
ncbi:MAG: 50S ribosomal protein L25 [Bacteroidota bacterium]